jgi:hypothetical protein
MAPQQAAALGAGAACMGAALVVNIAIQGLVQALAVASPFPIPCTFTSLFCQFVSFRQSIPFLFLPAVWFDSLSLTLLAGVLRPWDKLTLLLDFIHKILEF